MKAHSYVLGSLLAGALALATVQGREHDGQQTKELWASQTERQGESRPRGTSKTGSQTSAKRAVKQPAQEITLTKDFREAAMLAKLAIEQLQNKMYAGDRIFELYQEEAQKAMTVADSKVRNLGDIRVKTLLSKFYEKVLILRLMRISERISQLAGSEAKPDESQALFLKYLKCGAHLGDTLSAGKYIGDGACADNPQQDNKP